MQLHIKKLYYVDVLTRFYSDETMQFAEKQHNLMLKSTHPLYVHLHIKAFHPPPVISKEADFTIFAPYQFILSLLVLCEEYEAKQCNINNMMANMDMQPAKEPLPQESRYLLL